MPQVIDIMNSTIVRAEVVSLDVVPLDEVVPDASCRALITSAYRTFSKKHKELIVKAIGHHFRSDKDLREAVAAIVRANSAFAGLDHRNVKNWIRNESSKNADSLARDFKKRGRQVNSEFEADVWNELVVWGIKEEMVQPETGIGPVQRVLTRVVVRTIAFSYAIMRARAVKVQVSAKWSANLQVQQLKFSNNWMKKFLKRHKVSRRRITTDRKNRCSLEEIRERLKQNQEAILSGGYSLSQIY